MGEGGKENVIQVLCTHKISNLSCYLIPLFKYKTVKKQIVYLYPPPSPTNNIHTCTFMEVEAILRYDRPTGLHDLVSNNPKIKLVGQSKS